MTERERALSLAEGLEPSASNIQRVARESSPESAAWAFLQWELRAKAESKALPNAWKMLYTREAMEQASHYRVAQYHASRFPHGSLVADLTCGIGSDLLAFAERGPVRGYELDAERFEHAGWNLRVNGFSADLRLEDSLAAEWDFDYAMADPARRVAGKRTLDPADFAPDPAQLAQRMAGLKLGLIKLSPMLPDAFLEGLGPRLEFVSYGGECREALVSCGAEAQPGRFAVHLEAGTILPAASVGTVDEPAAYLYEADPAAIRAHALGGFELSGLGDSNGYLTGDRLIDSPWLTGYRVVEFGRFDLKALRAVLRRLGIGRVVVKSRAPGVDVVRVGKELRDEGGEGIVAFYPVGRSVRFVVLERL